MEANRASSLAPVFVFVFVPPGTIKYKKKVQQKCQLIYKWSPVEDEGQERGPRGRWFLIKEQAAPGVSAQFGQFNLLHIVKCFYKRGKGGTAIENATQ